MFKILQSTLSCSLGFVAVDNLSNKTRSVQLPADFVRTVLSAGKDYGPLHLLIAQQCFQCRAFLRVTDHDRVLLDLCDSDFFWGHIDANGLI